MSYDPLWRFAQLSVLLMSCINGVHCWSAEGHVLVIKLLKSILHQFVEDYMVQHIGSPDRFEEASLYADKVEWSDELHFSYTPNEACSAFVLERDCGRNPNASSEKRCIVTAIANYTDRASDPSLTPGDRAEAIKFLLHLIPDIHQPLHTGFRKDSGGTLIILENFQDREVTLHGLWDLDLVKMLINSVVGKSMNSLVLGMIEDINNISGKAIDIRLSDVASTTYEQALNAASLIASETSVHYTCKHAYKENNIWITRAVSKEYRKQRTKVVRLQLLKSARRLAALLTEVATLFNTRVNAAAEANTMLGNESDHPSSHKESKFEASKPIEATSFRSANIYDFLDCDIDDLLFDGDNQNDEDMDIEPTPDENDNAKASTTSSSSELVAKKKKPSTYLFPGQYPKRLALVKRVKSYIVTSKRLARNTEYFPQTLEIHEIFYRKGNLSSEQGDSSLVSVFIGFDTAVFGTDVLTRERVVQIMMAVKDENIDNGELSLHTEAKAAANDIVIGDDHRWDYTADYPTPKMRELLNIDDPFIEIDRGAAIEFRSIPGMTKFDIQKSKLLNNPLPIVFCNRHKDVYFISTLKTLAQPIQNVMSFNKYKVLEADSNRQVSFIVDRHLYDSLLDEDVLDYFIDVCSEKRRKFTFEFIRLRPTLLREIDMLHEIIASKQEVEDVAEMYMLGEPVLWNFKFVPDSDEMNYNSLEWIVNPELS